ncbi:MAG: TadE/TadG family type IV pilus assembly protein [Pirellulales bacterium]
MVEFAIVAPLFIMLVFGIMEFGRMVMVQQVLANAVREGARVAVLDGATATSITTSVNRSLNMASVPNAIVTVSPSNPSTAALGDPITVTARLTYGQVSWLPAPMYVSREHSLQASCVMRREAAQ